MSDPFVKQALREARARDLLERLDHAAEQADYLLMELDLEDRIARDALNRVATAIAQVNEFVAEILAEMKDQGGGPRRGDPLVA